jgi:hypothetical protein
LGERPRVTQRRGDGQRGGEREGGQGHAAGWSGSERGDASEYRVARDTPGVRPRMPQRWLLARRPEGAVEREQHFAVRVERASRPARNSALRFSSVGSRFSPLPARTQPLPTLSIGSSEFWQMAQQTGRSCVALPLHVGQHRSVLNKLFVRLWHRLRTNPCDAIELIDLHV